MPTWSWAQLTIKKAIVFISSFGMCCSLAASLSLLTALVVSSHLLTWDSTFSKKSSILPSRVGICPGALSIALVTNFLIDSCVAFYIPPFENEAQPLNDFYCNFPNLVENPRDSPDYFLDSRNKSSESLVTGSDNKCPSILKLLNGPVFDLLS